MRPLEHLRAIREILERESSPFRRGLLADIPQFEYGLQQHEACMNADEIPPQPKRKNITTTAHTAPNRLHTPSETALGHKPAGKTVHATETHTDAALAVLDCAD